MWQQRDADFELIVIDGASTDGSREWLEAHRARITTFISEPDAGVYDAMNKGVAAARGEWVYFLGADDRLFADTLLHEALGCLRDTTSGVLAGEAVYDDGRVYRLRAHPNPVARNFVHHQAAFYRRSLFQAEGGFDTTLAVMADYELNVRLWKGRVDFLPIPLRIAACGIGGRSDGGGWRGYREEIAVRHRHFSLVHCLLWDALSVVRFLRKQVVRQVSNPHG